MGHPCRYGPTLLAIAGPLRKVSPSRHPGAFNARSRISGTRLGPTTKICVADFVAGTRVATHRAATSRSLKLVVGPGLRGQIRFGAARGAILANSAIIH